MAEHYRFFNSAEGDIREYTAAEFAEYFNSFIGDGIYTSDDKVGLKVSPGEGLSLKIDTGLAFVRGYMYKNDSVINKQLDSSDTMLDRIDRVVLRFDEIAREIKAKVKTGTFSSTPKAPEIEVTDAIKEMPLAQIRIRKGATAIQASDITDERFTEDCGLVFLKLEIPWTAVFSGAEEPPGIKPRDIWLREL